MVLDDKSDIAKKLSNYHFSFRSENPRLEEFEKVLGEAVRHSVATLGQCFKSPAGPETFQDRPGPADI